MSRLAAPSEVDGDDFLLDAWSDDERSVARKGLV